MAVKRKTTRSPSPSATRSPSSTFTRRETKARPIRTREHHPRTTILIIHRTILHHTLTLMEDTHHPRRPHLHTTMEHKAGMTTTITPTPGHRPGTPQGRTIMTMTTAVLRPRYTRLAPRLCLCRHLTICGTQRVDLDNTHLTALVDPASILLVLVDRDNTHLLLVLVDRDNTHLLPALVDPVNILHMAPVGRASTPRMVLVDPVSILRMVLVDPVSILRPPMPVGPVSSPHRLVGPDNTRTGPTEEEVVVVDQLVGIPSMLNHHPHRAGRSEVVRPHSATAAATAPACTRTTPRRSRPWLQVLGTRCNHHRRRVAVAVHLLLVFHNRKS